MNLSEIGQKLLNEEQKHLRLMVVEGKFPLPPNELIFIVVSYALQNKENIRDECIKSLQNMPPQIIKNFVTQTNPDERCLYFLSYVFQKNIDILRSILQHPNVSVKVLRLFSKLSDAEILKIIIENEEKWINDAEVVNNLLNNKALPREFYQKILQHHKVENQNIQSPAQEDKKPQTATINKANLEKAFAKREEERLFVDEVKEDDEEKKRSIAGKISKMGVAEKIKLATLGNKEVRGILIKDTNKLVCTAVLKNPRITEGEIIKFSQDKNMPDEIIRMIANDRNWTQNYNVKLNLVMNPKTPIQNAIKFLPSLGVKDLASVAKSKNVSAQLATMARKIMVTRKG
ncbi:MAG: hypothetical protein OHK0040_06210 [bacterium]